MQAEVSIERYLNDDNFSRIETDFKFLIKQIVASKGELGLEIRNNYFNVYYKGNSLAKISFKDNEVYEIKIHEGFYDGTAASKDTRFPSSTPKSHYHSLQINRDLIHPFFQQKYLDEFMANIKKRGWGEEVTFEQQIITDNMKREDLIIIDRQVTDNIIKGRIDLLALKQIEGNRYSFLVIEVKLGNNVELQNEVAEQLNAYVKHVKDNLVAFSGCYQKQYSQKKRMGLLDVPHESIEIDGDVEGCVVVIGYSGLAENKIKALKNNHPNINVVVKNFKLQPLGWFN